MKLYSHTPTLNTISVRMLHVCKHHHTKHLFLINGLGTKVVQNTLISHTLTLTTISVCVACMHMPLHGNTYILHYWSVNQSEENKS
jgi:hypothetical protein